MKHPAFRLPGAYTVRHVGSGLHYVGTTPDLYGCYVQMLNTLQHGRHSNVEFQRAYSQDGRLDFFFVITDTQAEAHLAEHEMLKKHAQEGNLFPSLVGHQ